MVQNRNRNSCGNTCSRDQQRPIQNYVKVDAVPVTVASDALGTLAGYIRGMVPAMAYVPTQEWRDVYCPEEGLSRGTIFAALDKPFEGRRGGCCR